MSLKLNSSGGGSITLQEPSTASNRTLTLPDNTGNLISSADSGTVSQGMLASGVAGNGPAFSATRTGGSNITLSSNTWTKVTFADDRFDTASCFDPATGRFTPNVAGYYFFTGRIQYASSTTGVSIFNSALYLNGVSVRTGSAIRFPTGENYNPEASNVSGLIYCNGSTDYVELYGWCVGSGTLTMLGGSDLLIFDGFLARAA